MTITGKQQLESLQRLLRWVVVASSIATVSASIIFWPAGICLVVANVIAAFLTNGRIRIAFACIAIVGAIIVLGLALLLLGVSGVSGAVDVSRM